MAIVAARSSCRGVGLPRCLCARVRRRLSGKAGPHHAETAGSYKFHLPISTRWNDNDMYHHVNNVQYLAMFDTVINTYLIRRGGTRPGADLVTGWCVESRCKYLAPLSFPQPVLAGLRVSKLSRSSVTYEVGIFGARGESETIDAARPDLYLAATGAFVHVFVGQAATSVEIPDRVRGALEALLHVVHTPHHHA